MEAGDCWDGFEGLAFGVSRPDSATRSIVVHSLHHEASLHLSTPSSSAQHFASIVIDTNAQFAVVTARRDILELMLSKNFFENVESRNSVAILSLYIMLFLY